MSYADVLQACDGVRAVLVTGPQRSGTTFTSKVLADDLRWRYRDEVDFHVDNETEWRHLTGTVVRAVVQCPSMMRHVHDVPDDVLVVVMRRPVAAIVESQRRIGWRWERPELDRYGLDEGVIADVKYRWWDAHKHEGPARWVELAYSDMATHPRWVPADRRVNFAPKQIAEGGDG